MTWDSATANYRRDWKADRPACQHTDDDPGIHWTEDTYGREHRVDCGCPCDECWEY